jgi:hypothetical protein
MRRHKHLRRLIRLRDAVLDYYNGEPNGVLPEDEGLWLIWCALEKDIKKCGLSPDFKIDGLRLYYYNELWKKVNDKDHALENMKIQLPPVVTYNDMKFDGTMERAEWLAKQPLPNYMYKDTGYRYDPEAK